MRIANLVFHGALLAAGPVLCQPIAKNGNACTIPTYITNTGDLPSQFGTTYQPAMTVQNSVNCMTVPAGFSIEAWAHEGTDPSNGGVGITAVQAFDFDEQGRLWAVEARDYPCQLNRNSDRILRLADTDGNGAADELAVIAGGVTLAQGIVKVNGGVVIVNSPIRYYSESGGSAQTWASPFDNGLNRDTKGNAGTLSYGLDNYIYGSNGYDSPGPRIWRINALGSTHTYQSFATTPCGNARGAGMDEAGEVFSSSANGCPAHHAGMMGQGVNNFGGSPVFYPATTDLDQWDFVGRFTAATNAHIYNSRLIPGWNSRTNRRLFVCEGTGHLCSMWSLTRNGATWSGAQSGTTAASANILAGQDAWVAPIMARTGPDGAIWVLDWYNRLMLHNPATPTCGNAAYASPLRNKTANRIYRVFPSGIPPEPILNLNIASEAERIATLNSQNLHWRLAAQRLLIADGATPSLLDALENVLKGRDSDAIGNDPDATHALWILNGLGEFVSNPVRWEPVFTDSAGIFRHPADVTVANALKAAPATQALADAVKAACVANHPNAAVRLQAFLALARMPAPAGGPAYTSDTTGTFVITAYTQAGGSKVSAGAPSCIWTAGPPTRIAGRPEKNQPRNDLQFRLTRGGFELKPNGRLGSGDLTVFDLRGNIAFRSTFNNQTQNWSEPGAAGLKHPLYLYVYREYNGEAFRGKLALTDAMY